jgi:hypothetical protein
MKWYMTMEKNMKTDRQLTKIIKAEWRCSDKLMHEK